MRAGALRPWQAGAATMASKAAAATTMTRGQRRSSARAMERSHGERCCGPSHGEGPEVDGACALVLDVLGEEEDGGEGRAHRLFDKMPQRG